MTLGLEILFRVLPTPLTQVANPEVRSGLNDGYGSKHRLPRIFVF